MKSVEKKKMYENENLQNCEKISNLERSLSAVVAAAADHPAQHSGGGAVVCADDG